jgi:predicted nucleic acid-binding Zn ribbon protein
MQYTYKCTKSECKECNKEIDILTSIANKDNHVCKECGEKLEQVDTFCTAFRMKGRW